MMPLVANSVGLSNLESFIQSTTPSVKSLRLRKSRCWDFSSDWESDEDDTFEHFKLNDLWDEYRKWSAYGTEVPILLPSGETVVQYYVPYLSGIQIFTNKAHLRPSNGGDRICNNNHRKSFNSMTESMSSDSDDLSLDENFLGYLYCEFFDSSPPFARIPLLDKVKELSKTYPRLMSFKNSELSPASWMSVAWYPIYHIPAKFSVKALTVCFLTYHKLATLIQASEIAGTSAAGLSSRSGNSEKKANGKGNFHSLYPFGLVTYKMQGNIWTMPKSGDCERLAAFFSAADSWLKELEVEHHDFTFFTTHFG